MRRLFLAGAMLAALLVPAASATAAPTGEFAVFAQCPTEKNLFLCIHNKTTAGSVTTGKKTVPIVNPVVLQGGVEVNETTGATQFYGAKNGVTLSKAAQPVPGGLLGIKAPTWWPDFAENWFNGLINEGFTGVTATVELARPANEVKVDLNALLSETNDPAVILPVKIKLDNAILGSNCYMGSSASPIYWKLTVGETSPPAPNKPIKGFVGNPETNEDGSILRFFKQRLVDNSFATPATSGCGGLFAFLVDPLVSSVVGVPAAAGNNTAILEGDMQTGYAPSVKASDP
ncbi:MAG TPA: hypothetical protein VFR75_12400 [Solirubrobacterales bacterium]|nr:hypothetical protein [Solirubrobacterales bacterium]